MNDIIKDLPISISIIDYIGKIDNGVALLLNMIAGEDIYEIGYWYDRNGNIRIVPEDKLLIKLNIDNIYDYDKINELIYFIHNSIPNTEEILNNFLNENKL
ncbi:hypothetical protein [Trichloromonas sp.]|uniref:hypothetical protein n=1 Tax=Trichloromonas sp. TaxID=3069249 RepID=UPI002A4CE8F8|nr:hypothetical protein [Trichloromonas sp.]